MLCLEDFRFASNPVKNKHNACQALEITYCPTKKTKKVEKAQKSYADVVSVSVKDSSSNANVTVEQDEDNYKLET